MKLFRMFRGALILLGIGEDARRFKALVKEFEAGKRRARVVAHTSGRTRERLIGETEKEIAERGVEYEAGFRKELREQEGHK